MKLWYELGDQLGHLKISDILKVTGTHRVLQNCKCWLFHKNLFIYSIYGTKHHRDIYTLGCGQGHHSSNDLHFRQKKWEARSAALRYLLDLLNYFFRDREMCNQREMCSETNQCHVTIFGYYVFLTLPIYIKSGIFQIEKPLVSLST